MSKKNQKDAIKNARALAKHPELCWSNGDGNLDFLKVELPNRRADYLLLQLDFIQAKLRAGLDFIKEHL